MKFKLQTLAAVAAAAAALLGATAANAIDGVYKLESTASLKSKAPGGWDYVSLDAEHGRLFIGRRADGATVYDIKSKKIVKTIDDSDDANSITAVPEFDRAYTSNGDGTSTVFQISTLKKLDKIKLGSAIDNGFFDPVTKQIIFTLGDDKKAVFVDAKTGKTTAELPIDSEKLDGTVADGEGHFFMALRDHGSIAKIDAASHALVGEWKTPGCDEPTGLTMDRANKRLFIGCRGKQVKAVLAVMDATNGNVITTLPIGRGNDGVVYDADTKKVFTSNGVDANLVVFNQVNADTYKLDQAVTTRPYARTMAYDAKTKKIYLITAEGYADPAEKITASVSPFYPNHYFADSFMVLTYAPAKGK